MLVGLTGAAGAGKGSVAAVMLAAGGWSEIGFADPLYAAVEAITGIPQGDLRDRRMKEQTIPWLGKSPREMLQLLGTEYGRKAISESLWVDRAMRRVAENEASGLSTVITDVRFDNEAAAIRAAGGVVWRVSRPGHKCLAGGTDKHESEAGVSVSHIDAEVLNTGTLEDLRHAVDAAINSLHAATIK